MSMLSRTISLTDADVQIMLTPISNDKPIMKMTQAYNEKHRYHK